MLGNLFKNVANTVTKTCQKHAPEILIGVGMAASVGAVALAIKATVDVQEPLKECKENLDSLKECKEDYEEQADYNKDLVCAYAKTAGVIAKHYAIPVALEITALGTMFASNKKSRERNAKLAGALTTVQGLYSKYRNNVIETYGEDVDRDMRLGTHTEKRTIEVEDPETGKKKKQKVDALVLDPDKMSDFAIIYSAETNANFVSNNFQTNLDTLAIRRNYIANIMRCNGYITVNEFLKYCGFDMDQLKIQGQVWGWAYDPNDASKPDYPDIRFYDVYDKDGNAAVLIDFANVELLDQKVWGGSESKKMGKILQRFRKLD